MRRSLFWDKLALSALVFVLVGACASLNTNSNAFNDSGDISENKIIDFLNASRLNNETKALYLSNVRQKIESFPYDGHPFSPRVNCMDMDMEIIGPEWTHPLAQTGMPGAVEEGYWIARHNELCRQLGNDQLVEGSLQKERNSLYLNFHEADTLSRKWMK